MGRHKLSDEERRQRAQAKAESVRQKKAAARAERERQKELEGLEVRLAEAQRHAEFEAARQRYLVESESAASLNESRMLQSMAQAKSKVGVTDRPTVAFFRTLSQQSNPLSL